MIPFSPHPPFSSNIFPLCILVSADEKEQIHNGAILEKKQKTVIKAVEQAEDEGKYGAGRTAAAFQETRGGDIPNTMACEGSAEREQWCGVWLTPIDMSSLTQMLSSPASAFFFFFFEVK